MQVLKGGIILLNLCAMSVALDGTTQSITDKDILEQLSELQMYTSKRPIIGYKPVLVQYRSNENGFSGVVLCSLISEASDIQIIGCDGRITIEIYCSFLQNEEEIPMAPYVLEGATVHSTLGLYTYDTIETDNDLKVGGNAKVGGNLQVDGTITKKVGSSYVPIPTKNIYQHLIVLKGTNALVVLKILCNEEYPMTSMSDVISLINTIFNDQGHSSTYPMTIDCNGFFVSNNYTVSINQLSFNGLLCTYETMDEGYGVETIVDTTTTFDKLGQIDTVKDTVYRLN